MSIDASALLGLLNGQKIQLTNQINTDQTQISQLNSQIATLQQEQAPYSYTWQKINSLQMQAGHSFSDVELASELDYLGPQFTADWNSYNNYTAKISQVQQQIAPIQNDISNANTQLSSLNNSIQGTQQEVTSQNNALTVNPSISSLATTLSNPSALIPIGFGIVILFLVLGRRK